MNELFLKVKGEIEKKYFSEYDRAEDNIIGCCQVNLSPVRRKRKKKKL